MHLVRAALKYVTDADSREVVRDLRNIDQAATVLEAEQALKTFGERWGGEYLNGLSSERGCLENIGLRGIASVLLIPRIGSQPTKLLSASVTKPNVR